MHIESNRLFCCVVAAVFGLGLSAGCEGKDDRGSLASNDGTQSATAESDSASQTDTGSESDTGEEPSSDTFDSGYASLPSTCAEAAASTTTVGCLFYAVDLDTHDNYENKQFAVTVSNPQQADTADVTVYKGGAAGWEIVSQVPVPPMSLAVIELAPNCVNKSGTKAKGSYKIEASVPIVATQFNPIDGSTSWLSDASTLVPATSLSQTYDIIGWKQNEGDGDMRAYFTVVATKDGTAVEIEPSIAPLPGGPVPGQKQTFTVDLDEGDVLEVESNAVGASFNGTRVTSNDEHPIAVFSGQECAFVPETAAACDHLEEQLPGLKFWGKTVVASRMPLRGDFAAERVLWQIAASQDNTTVTLEAGSGDPGLPVSPFQMNRGQVQEFLTGGTEDAPADFVIRADKPIGVLQYMVGLTNFDMPKDTWSEQGDPSMVYMSPAEQFLPRYVLLVPGTWINDVLVITRRSGAAVSLDGETLADAAFSPVGTSGFDVARVAVDDGVHVLESLEPGKGLGVLVVGWDEYDSYAYAGGMGLQALNPVVK